MKLEDQVCSLKLSIQLKKLGVKQEAQFYWLKANCWSPETNGWTDTVWTLEPNGFQFRDGIAAVGAGVDHESVAMWNSRIAAFTVAELGEMIPSEYSSYSKKCKVWCCWSNIPETSEFYSMKEADSRSKFLIHLIKKGIVKL